MSETTEPRDECCVIGCSHRAVWRIKDGPMPDDFTDACELHISELLQIDRECTVWAISMEDHLQPSPDPSVTINATGLPEFDRLVNVLTTIHMMSDDPRIKAFIEAEATQVPGTPLAHTFDLLNKAGELTFDPVANAYIAEALAALDDAKQCVAEDAVHFVVLNTLHRYLDELVGKRIVSQ